jgi:regulation of enolase protein 1 (concanavalin A-like superfamily)
MEAFSWLYPPPAFTFTGPSSVKITTGDKTDFWQRTFYGFRNDNGHFLHKGVTGNFVLTAVCHSAGDTLYDQCGLLVRLDEDNWIKCSCEFETTEFSHLGSVVTNLGYSDWSKQEIPASIRAIKYRIERRGQDFFVSAGLEDGPLKEIRVGHLHRQADELLVGVYACSPQRAGFECEISEITIAQ